MRWILVCCMVGFGAVEAVAGQTGYASSKEAVYEAIVLTEASGEPFEGKVGVAEVLRNRNFRTSGFSGILREDLNDWLRRERRNGKTVQDSRRALRIACAGSDTVHGATHFENVEVFGRPRWAKGMKVTAKIGRHTFLKSKEGIR